MLPLPMMAEGVFEEDGAVPFDIGFAPAVGSIRCRPNNLAGQKSDRVSCRLFQMTSACVYDT